MFSSLSPDSFKHVKSSNEQVKRLLRPHKRSKPICRFKHVFRDVFLFLAMRRARKDLRFRLQPVTLIAIFLRTHDSRRNTLAQGKEKRYKKNTSIMERATGATRESTAFICE